MTGDLFWIFIAAMVVNNFTLTYFLGLCPFMGVSGKVYTALRMGAANIFVLTVASVSAWFLNSYILPHAPYLRLISFILVIASAVQITELLIKKLSPNLFRALGIYLPLITTNCAVLGVALLNVQQQHDLLQSAWYGFGAAAGFGLVLISFSAMRERLAYADVPLHFRGAPIALITAGLMALAFMGFAGLAKL